MREKSIVMVGTESPQRSSIETTIWINEVEVVEGKSYPDRHGKAAFWLPGREPSGILNLEFPGITSRTKKGSSREVGLWPIPLLLLT